MPIKTLLLFIIFSLATLLSGAAESLNLRILHFNDVYEVAAQKDPLGQSFAGFPELKTLIDQKRKESEHSLLTFGGDLLPATLEGCPLSYQDKIILMNHLGIDAAVLGNHEFDHGVKETLSLIHLSTFPWVNSNIEFKDHTPFGKTIPYKIYTFGDTKVALIGFTLPEAEYISSPGSKVVFTDPITTAKSLVAKLKAEGVDVIIAITHQNLQEDKSLLMAIPEIDLIVGGHEHEPIVYFINQKQMVFKAGFDARYLGVIDLKIEEYKNQQGKHTYIIPTWEIIPVRNQKPDPELLKLIQKLQKNLPKHLNETLATLDVPLNSRRSDLDSKRTSMGTFVAKALQHELGTQIGVVNGGGIRGDKLYLKGATLTRKNILQELPFEDVCIICDISGADLKQWLENSLADSTDPNGSFLQTSGITYTINPNSPTGKRTEDIRIHGEPLDIGKTYSLATIDYLASGKDGFQKLVCHKETKTKRSPSDVVISYLEKQKEVTRADISD